MARRVASKKATKARSEADVRATAERFAHASGSVKSQSPDKAVIAELEDAFADAAGVPIVVDAVRASTQIRARRATGWPVTAWVSKLQPDPPKRLHINLGAEGREIGGASCRGSVCQHLLNSVSA